MVDHKKVLMKLWNDTFSVVEYPEYVKPNGATGCEEAVVLENEPCKLSFSSLSAVNQSETTAAIVQSTKLFCDNTIEIKAGSKIIVNRDGQTFEYKQSGEPGVFSVHQEIVLVPYKDFA
jgi:hypothetical protein